METFCIVALIFYIILAVSKGTQKLLGPIGCLLLLLIFIVMTCVSYNEEVQKEEENRRKADEAVEEIRKRKQRYPQPKLQMNYYWSKSIVTEFILQ